LKKKRFLKLHELYESNGCILYKGRVVVPQGQSELIKEICEGFHCNLDHIHPGQNETYHLIKKYFWWKRMNDEINDFVKHCENCQRGKYGNKSVGKMIPLGVPTGK